MAKKAASNKIASQFVGKVVVRNDDYVIIKTDRGYCGETKEGTTFGVDEAGNGQDCIQDCRSMLPCTPIVAPVEQDDMADYVTPVDSPVQDAPEIGVLEDVIDAIITVSEEKLSKSERKRQARAVTAARKARSAAVRMGNADASDDEIDLAVDQYQEAIGALLEQDVPVQIIEAIVPPAPVVEAEKVEAPAVAIEPVVEHEEVDPIQEAKRLIEQFSNIGKVDLSAKIAAKAAYVAKEAEKDEVSVILYEKVQGAMGALQEAQKALAYGRKELAPLFWGVDDEAPLIERIKSLSGLIGASKNTTLYQRGVTAYPRVLDAREKLAEANAKIASDNVIKANNALKDALKAPENALADFMAGYAALKTSQGNMHLLRFLHWQGNSLIGKTVKELKAQSLRLSDDARNDMLRDLFGGILQSIGVKPEVTIIQDGKQTTLDCATNFRAQVERVLDAVAEMRQMARRTPDAQGRPSLSDEDFAIVLKHVGGSTVRKDARLEKAPYATKEREVTVMEQAFATAKELKQKHESKKLAPRVDAEMQEAAGFVRTEERQ